MTERNTEKINPLSIADNSNSKDNEDDLNEEDPIGFVVICNEHGLPKLHEIPDHRTPNNKELFHINWFLIGSLIGESVTEQEDSE